MLSAFRAFAKSWPAAVLIGLLIVAFAVFGFHDVFRRSPKDAVVTAGARTVTSLDFRKEFDDARRRAEQQMQQPVTVEVAAANGLDRQILQAIGNREGFAALLDKMHVRPSDKLVGEQIAKISAFFDPITGRFDKKQYEQRLAQGELTPARFEGMLRDQIAGEHLVSALVTDLLVPRAYSALAAAYGLEKRDISYLAVDPGSVPPLAPPTDTQLTAFMQEHAQQLTRPEARVLTLVRFSPAELGSTLPVDEAEARKRYEFRKDTLGAPETRTLIQIPAKDAATAQAIIGRLTRGEAPAAIARSLGVVPICYAAKPKRAIPDRKVADAAFRLAPGQPVAVQGDLGVSVVRVDGVTPGKVVTFEEARPAIEAELRKDAAAEKVYGLSQAYDDAHQKGANLAEAAKKVGVPTTVVGPVTRDGRDLQAQPVMGLGQKILDAAFTLPAGGESEVTDAGGGEYFAVRVDKIVPPTMPPLEAVRPQLTRAWMTNQLIQRMQARADALAARARKGETLEALSASGGVRLVHVPGLDRQTGQQNPLVTSDILGAAFGGKPGEVFVAPGQNFFAVGKVDAVRVGDLATLAASAEQVRPQMTSTVFGEIGASAQVAARQKMKVKIDYERARAAIGLPPLAGKDAAGKAEQGKPGLAK
jgi:peptidyl-prolyl cis-trans isomerase D